jgi:hypothetical protein
MGHHHNRIVASCRLGSRLLNRYRVRHSVADVSLARDCLVEVNKRQSRNADRLSVAVIARISERQAYDRHASHRGA